MKMMALLPVIPLLLITACSTTTKKSKKYKYNPTVSEQAEYYRVQEQLIEKDLPNCKGCIHGSAHEQTFTALLKTYEIESVAARELGLRNTQSDIVTGKQIGRAHV